jgi:hypothetical protein
LDALWIQIAGTVCNLSCAHCFVPSGPGNRRHDLLDRAHVASRVDEGVALGVREIYFTGGEPFIHPELIDILRDTLARAPATVLTNGTLFTRAHVASLRELSDSARYALEIRVSLDGPTAGEHDRLRGPGAFARTCTGLRRLDEVGLLPIVTVTNTSDADPFALRESIAVLLRGLGITRPRIKLLPLFRLGREVGRGRGYEPSESLAAWSGAELDAVRLPCATCRAVTSQGVFVCPLLVDEPSARMGSRMTETLGSFPLAEGACFTCWTSGSTCSNS